MNYFIRRRKGNENKENITSPFGRRLRELRKIKGYSQQEVSKALYLGISTYGTYETGRYIPDAKCIVQLAEFYKVSTDYLLGREDYTENKIECKRSIQRELNCAKNKFENAIKIAQKEYFKEIEEILKRDVL